eukprot:TRINITY_DN3149_c0_g1_i2.p1 TRINITY_DN3149_c0_g1~~TRINITY_DN3149_c0_g1_i2.p1  ORF type:complete len:746 (-),score=58.88 TRINITY_DN3149_c0_g1_i2:108-2240(-)
MPHEDDTRGITVFHGLEDEPPNVPLYESSSRFLDLESRVVALEEKFRIYDIAEGEFVINGQVKMFQTARQNTLMLTKPAGDINCTPSEPMDECEDPCGGSLEQTDVLTHVERGTNVDSQDEYVLAETVWDAVLVLGHPEISPVASTLLLFCVLISIAVPLFMCVTMAQTDDFIPRENLSMYTPLVDAMHRWRLTDGHTLNSLDLNGVNLVSRVCYQDSALSVGDRQAHVLGVINDYLSFDDSRTEEHSLFSIGPLLSMACIFCYCLVVLAEFRRVSRLVFALLALPMGQRSQFNNKELVSISFGRLTCFLCMVIVRVVIAGSLLFEGTIWLSTTNDIPELLLNTAAISFVLEVDELLFHAMLPATVQSVLVTLKPLHYRRARWNLESISAIVCAFIVVYLAYTNVMVNNINTMLEVRRAMCGGFKEFVSVKNSAGIMVGRRTTKVSKTDIKHKYDLQAVQELIEAGDPLRNATFAMSAWFGPNIDVFQEFYTDASSTLSKLPCLDLDGGFLLLDAQRYMSNTVKAIAAEQKKKVVSETFTCSAYRDLCNDLEHSLLRAVCPLTCGCDVPTSGLPLSQKSQNYGCPLSCSKRVDEQVRNASCTDLPVTGNSPQDSAVRIGWERYWQTVTHHAARKFPWAVDDFKNFSNNKITNGCIDTSLDPVSQSNFCSEDDPTPAYLGVRSIAAFCPRACCQRSGAVALLDVCPAACQT